MEKLSNAEVELKKSVAYKKSVYLRCFAVVLRGIHRKVDICQTDYSTYSKLRIVPYSEVMHGNTTFKLKKG